MVVMISLLIRGLFSDSFFFPEHHTMDYIIRANSGH